jgi:C-terminal processing protease CtpA/Prc
VSCASIEKYNAIVTQVHTVEDLQEDVDKVYKQLQRLHPRLYQFTPKETLDFKFDSLKSAITPMTSRDFYKQLTQVTKYVGQGHFSVSPPSKRYDRKERKALNKLEFDVNNLDFEYVDNKLIVAKAKGKDSLLLHAEVLKVNDENTADLISTYKKRIASDGVNTTFHDRVVGDRFMRYYANDKGRFDSISFTLRNVDSTFIKKYKRVAKPKKNMDSIIAVKTDSVKQVRKKLTKAEKKSKKAKSKREFKERRKYGEDYFTKERNRNLQFIGKDSTVALMKIRTFSNYGSDDFYEYTFKTIDSLNIQSLVIDLRDNFGGSLAEISNLYSYLTNENFTFINKSETNSRIPILKATMSNSQSLGVKMLVGLASPILLTHNLLKTNKKEGNIFYKFKQSKEQEPNPLNFKGKIYVLINGNSFSASSILSTQLKGSNRATFVGEETGGAYNGTVAGLYKIYELPNTKLSARIGLMHIDSKFKIEPDGFGIKPDVEILPTYQNRLDGVDPELEWVLKDIEKTN